MCVVDGETPTAPAVIRCLDCGPQYFVCQKCADIDHRYRPLHVLEIWQVFICTTHHFTYIGTVCANHFCNIQYFGTGTL